MPNRYEREIEEILRNLEGTEPKAGRNQKSGERRRKPAPRMRTNPRSSFSFHFSTTEWLLIVAVGAALLAGGYAYAQARQDLFTGIVAIVSVLCLILVAVSQFLFQPRRAPAHQYGNVRPIRRSPLGVFKTQWNLFMLKLRYRRRNGNGES
jgi:hypothetical protein